VPRIVKTHDVRRDEILDCAQQLITRRGYEQMTIQNILDELHIAKGTFYHYFDSKQHLLEAVVGQLIDSMEQLLAGVLDDQDLPAAQTLNQFFNALGRNKLTQQPLMLALLRVWYSDDNAIVRHKVRTTMLQRLTPLLARVIRRGTERGEFSTTHSDEAAEVLLSLSQDLVDAVARLLLAGDSKRGVRGAIKRTTAAYSEAVERALGVTPGALVLADHATLEASVSYLGRNLRR
jgi:AcrR family transcriptional regulator